LQWAVHRPAKPGRMVRPLVFCWPYYSESTRLPPPTGAILWVAACYFAGFGAILHQKAPTRRKNLARRVQNHAIRFWQNQRNKPGRRAAVLCARSAIQFVLFA